MIRIQDFFAYISKSTTVCFEKFLTLKGFFIKESTLHKQDIGNYHSLRDAIIKHVYKQPSGFLVKFKKKIVFLRVFSKLPNTKSQNKTIKKDDKYTTIQDAPEAYIELVSLHISNNVLEKVTKEKILIDKVLSDNNFTSSHKL